MRRVSVTVLASIVALLTAGCRPQSGDPAVGLTPNSRLVIGFGLTTGQSAEAGIEQVIQNLTLEALVSLGRDGRPVAWLAEGWESSPDGLALRVQLKPGVRFHDGTPLTATTVASVLSKRLPTALGPAMEQIESIRARSETELEFSLRRPSRFVIEALYVPIQDPSSSAGTGPFQVTTRSADQVDLVANPHHHAGKPAIDNVQIRGFSSVRAAWADMLRGDVDVLYEVGADALEFLKPSDQVKLFTFPRTYAYAVVINVNKPYLRDRRFRQQLNAAVDRGALIRDVLGGLGRPAGGSVWPDHWAYDSSLPSFGYAPSRVQSAIPRLKLLTTEPSHERMALVVQQQLGQVGVTVELESATLDLALGRVQTGDFDLFLADIGLGPTLGRANLFWRSGSPYNVGGYSSSEVDQALDAIQGAVADDAYREGVAAFQRAIVDDPPAIFLAWSERARAVSTRFEVPVEPNRDVLSILRLWKPAASD